MAVTFKTKLFLFVFSLIYFILVIVLFIFFWRALRTGFCFSLVFFQGLSSQNIKTESSSDIFSLSGSIFEGLRVLLPISLDNHQRHNETCRSLEMRWNKVMFYYCRIWFKINGKIYKG